MNVIRAMLSKKHGKTDAPYYPCDQVPGDNQV